METDALNIHLECEALHIGDSEIGGATLEVSTNNAELANKLVYLGELLTSIIATKRIGEQNHEKKS